MTAQIFDQQDSLIKTFNGFTNECGYYSDGFFVPDNFGIGTYTLQITAEKDGALDFTELVFHIFVRSDGSSPSSGGSPPDGRGPP